MCLAMRAELALHELAMRRAYTLAVKDLDNRPWEFVVKSWANGSEQRRVYVLEQASMFLRVNHLREGDIIGICCDEAGNLQVAANTPALSEAIARPNYSLNFARPTPKPLPGTICHSSETHSNMQNNENLTPYSNVFLVFLSLNSCVSLLAIDAKRIWQKH